MTTATATQETTPLKVGSLAPDFTLKDNADKDFHLGEFRGRKNVILFFYPLDWSPTCTKENVCFTNDLSKFAKYGEVAGVSIDSTWSHKAWAEKLGLKHRLLADIHREATKAFGLFLPAANISQRATVVVDKAGKIAFIKVNSDIKIERDYAEVESFLKTLG